MVYFVGNWVSVLCSCVIIGLVLNIDGCIQSEMSFFPKADKNLNVKQNYT